jgi:hypothetical protein
MRARDNENFKPDFRLQAGESNSKDAEGRSRWDSIRPLMALT